MSAKLVAEEGDLKGLILSFDEGSEWIIGRDPDASQLVIEDPAVSRKHASCRLTNEGILVENLSATSSVFINEEEIKTPRLLQQGDTMRIGSQTFRFYRETTAQFTEENRLEQKAEVVPASEQDEVPPAVQTALLISPEVKQEEASEGMKLERDTIFEEEPSNEKVPLADINFNLLETGRWLLKVIGGPNNGAEFSMQTGKNYLFGTDPNLCDIVFHDTSVSRQHARISIDDEETMSIEDLKSRNGTLVDGRPIQGKQPLATNILVTLGTTSLIIYDREGEMQTIISPLLPSIVKVLQQEENKKAEKTPKNIAGEGDDLANGAGPLAPPQVKTAVALGGFILIAIITGMFIVAGIGAMTLFRSEPITITHVVDEQAVLKDALAPFSNVKWSFTKSTGNLLLLGHVLTPADKSQLLYNLHGLKFIKSIDENAIIVDEYEATEINLILSQNPAWKGISIQTPSAGKFMATGYLKDKRQAELLSEYLGVNFRYPDLLTNRVVVEEDILSQISVMLREEALRDITVQISNGEVTLSGTIPGPKKEDLRNVYNKIKELTGVRDVKSFVVLLNAESGVVDISDKYEITGISTIGNQINVVINGKILSTGDAIDGMIITSIRPNAVFLEKDNVSYKVGIKQ